MNVRNLEMSEQQLIRALEAALQSEADGGGLTTRELVEILGISPKKVNQGLHRLKAVGRLETVKVIREDLAGRITRIPGYRVRGDLDQDHGLDHGHDHDGDD